MSWLEDIAERVVRRIGREAGEQTARTLRRVSRDDASTRRANDEAPPRTQDGPSEEAQEQTALRLLEQAAERRQQAERRDRQREGFTRKRMRRSASRFGEGTIDDDDAEGYARGAAGLALSMADSGSPGGAIRKVVGGVKAAGELVDGGSLDDAHAAWREGVDTPLGDRVPVLGDIVDLPGRSTLAFRRGVERGNVRELVDEVSDWGDILRGETSEQKPHAWGSGALDPLVPDFLQSDEFSAYLRDQQEHDPDAYAAGTALGEGGRDLAAAGAMRAAGAGARGVTSVAKKAAGTKVGGLVVDTLPGGAARRVRHLESALSGASLPGSTATGARAAEAPGIAIEAAVMRAAQRGADGARVASRGGRSVDTLRRLVRGVRAGASPPQMGVGHAFAAGRAVAPQTPDATDTASAPDLPADAGAEQQLTDAELGELGFSGLEPVEDAELQELGFDL